MFIVYSSTYCGLVLILYSAPLQDDDDYYYYDDDIDASQSKLQLLKLAILYVTLTVVFTTLHAMQTRYSDENSVCPSVRLSHDVL